MLTHSGRFKLAHSDVTCENFDGEYVVLNLASGQYFALSQSASIILDGILKGFDVRAITETLAEGAAAKGDEVDKLLAELIHYRLISPEVGADPVSLTAEWADAARAIDDPLLLEVFNDIADLIAADPIHESDEGAGWPAAKQ